LHKTVEHRCDDLRFLICLPHLRAHSVECADFVSVVRVGVYVGPTGFKSDGMPLSIQCGKARQKGSVEEKISEPPSFAPFWRWNSSYEPRIRGPAPPRILPQDHLIEVRKKLRNRRDLPVQRRNSTALVSCVSPRGAFCPSPRIDISGGDDVFTKELILQKHVMVVHGSGFGRRPGTKYFWIVFLPNEKTLSTDYEAIGEFMQERYKC